MKRAVLYLRVSTIDQTTANQERELREIAARMGCDITKVYKDHGISGAKGRDKRPAFDALCRDATKRQFDVIMAWSVDRLGRSLQDLVGFLSSCTPFGSRECRAPSSHQGILTKIIGVMETARQNTAASSVKKSRNGLSDRDKFGSLGNKSDRKHAFSSAKLIK